MKFWLSNNTDRYSKWIFEHNIAFWKGFSHLIVCFILLVTFLRGFVIGLKLLRRGARVKRDKLLDWTFLQLCYPHNSTTRQATRHFHCKAFKCWLWRNTTHLILLWWFIYHCDDFTKDASEYDYLASAGLSLCFFVRNLIFLIFPLLRLCFYGNFHCTHLI